MANLGKYIPEKGPFTKQRGKKRIWLENSVSSGTHGSCVRGYLEEPVRNVKNCHRNEVIQVAGRN